jgi:TadE-like protein
MHTAELKRRRHRERGASAVEFAIVAPLLFFLLFAIVDLCALFWVNLTMQYAVREGARYAITGRSDLDPTPVPGPAGRQRHFAVLEAIKASSMGLYDRVDARVNGVRHGDAQGWRKDMFGTSGQVFVLRLDCSWPLMTPILRPFFADGKYRFTVAATMRNEDF